MYFDCHNKFVIVWWLQPRSRAFLFEFEGKSPGKEVVVVGVLFMSTNIWYNINNSG